MASTTSVATTVRPAIPLVRRKACATSATASRRVSTIAQPTTVTAVRNRGSSASDTMSSRWANTHAASTSGTATPIVNSSTPSNGTRRIVGRPGSTIDVAIWHARRTSGRIGLRLGPIVVLEPPETVERRGVGLVGHGGAQLYGRPLPSGRQLLSSPMAAR